MLSVFVGIRPLVKSGDGKLTAALSRDHTIHIDASGLLTTTGGKWTTYRNMAEHTVDQAADFARLAERPCVTRTLNVHGFHSNAERFGALSVYGSDALGDSGSDARHARRWPRRSIRSCRTPAPKSCGRPVTRWRAPSRTCSRAGRARCSSTPAPRKPWRPEVARLMAGELGWDAARGRLPKRRRSRRCQTDTGSSDQDHTRVGAAGGDHVSGPGPGIFGTNLDSSDDRYTKEQAQ